MAALDKRYNLTENESEFVIESLGDIFDRGMFHSSDDVKKLRDLINKFGDKSDRYAFKIRIDVVDKQSGQ